MTDTTETTPGPLRVTTCYDPTGRTVYCHGLVEDTHDARREHRKWHKHEEDSKDGFRRAIRARDEEIAKLSRELTEARGDVQRIVIPEPVLGIEISRDGWAADDDDWDDEPAQESQYAADDAYDDQQAATRADAEAAFSTEPASPDGYFNTPRPA